MEQPTEVQVHIPGKDPSAWIPVTGGDVPKLLAPVFEFFDDDPESGGWMSITIDFGSAGSLTYR